MTDRDPFEPAPHGPSLPGKMAAVLVVAVLAIGLWGVLLLDPLGIAVGIVRGFR